MLAVRAVLHLPSSVTCKSIILQRPLRPLTMRVQCFANESRSAFRRAARQKSLKEIALAPAGESAFTIGKGALAGASAFGLGALCYYGIGLSNEVGAIDKSVAWPKYVKDRIAKTYMYFSGSIAITAAAAVAASRSPALMTFMIRSPMMSLALSIGAMIGSGVVAQSIPYQSGFGLKQLAWMAHCGIVGCVVAPICFLGGPLLTRAAWYTTGVIGGLSALAVCAPSEKFLYMGAPLAIGFGVVLVSALGSMFLAPGTAIHAGLYSMSLYGGLIVFSGLLLYDTQRIIQMAENQPLYGVDQFDPINASISIYLDTLNIFVRIVQILAGGGNRRK